jgi:hypothetical protein
MLTVAAGIQRYSPLHVMYELLHLRSECFFNLRA